MIEQPNVVPQTGDADSASVESMVPVRDTASASGPPDGASDSITALALSISRQGLTVPATFLLELLKPFSFALSQFLLVADPLLAPLGVEMGDRYGRLLEDRHNIDRLLDAIENPPYLAAHPEREGE
ncbi:MAG: hypothetical protein A2Y73_02760 [Chloroflexi bacterium RBG_13_56_8]|nr:MAG: hypothetical protein A2Y73_02760 [Chloroflexi bacterium RBG_13_56_8]